MMEQNTQNATHRTCVCLVLAEKKVRSSMEGNVVTSSVQRDNPDRLNASTVAEKNLQPPIERNFPIDK